MLPEDLIENLRHWPTAENSLTEALGQTGQPGAHTHLTKPAPCAVIALDDFVQLTMDTTIRRPDMQSGRTVQQAGEVKRRVIDQQFHVEHKRFADGFATGKGQDFEGVGQSCYIQTK
ncbi:hypothetical protein D3C85_1087230 [compost metagenome]